MAMVLYDLSLRLKTVVVICEEGINSGEQERRLKIAINGLIGSLEQFELLSGASLQFITEEELAKFPNYPQELNQP